MEQNTVPVDPMLERLEKWKAEKGRVNKPDKPWIPKYKKLHNKSLNAIDGPSLTDCVPQDQNAAKFVKPNPVHVLKEKNVERRPISQNLDAKSRRELLEEWKMQKKLREAELQQLKAKERRWTICGVASNQRRESTVSSKSIMNKSTGVNDRGLLPPKKSASYVVQPPMQRKLASGNVEANLEVQETTAKTSAVTDKARATSGTLPKVRFSTSKTRVTTSNVRTTTVHSQTTFGGTQPTARPQATTSKTQIVVSKASVTDIGAPVTTTRPPSMPAKSLKLAKDPAKTDIKAHVTIRKASTMSATSLKMTKDPVMTVDGRVTSGKASVTISKAPAVTERAQLVTSKPPVVIGKAQLMKAKVPMMVNKVLASSKAPETNSKAMVNSQMMTGSGEMSTGDVAATSKPVARFSGVWSRPPSIQPRMSLSTLHRKQVWKGGHKDCLSPAIPNKFTRPSEFKKAKASHKLGWNSGTKVSNAAKFMLGAKNLTDSGILVKYRRTDGILKNGTEAKSPKVKKSVAFMSPIRSPDDPPLNERLVSWLLENNHSPCEYRHLQSLGACLTDVKSPDFDPDETVKSPGTPDTVTVNTSDLDEGQSLTRLSQLLGELNRLLQNSYPVNQASEWLDLMYERVPEVRLMAAYWLCRARVSLSCGCTREDALELVEHGIREGAQPVVDLVTFKKQRTRTSTPRHKMKCQKENIFNSTLVRFKVDEIVEKTEKPLKEVLTPLKEVVTPLRVTPVRRSHRLTHCPSSESTFASVDDIPADMKPRLVLTPNRFFKVDTDSKPEQI